MHPRAALLFFITILLIAPLPASAEALSQPLLILVRHAEKADDDPRDPSLSEAGKERAEALAKVLAHSPPVAIFVSPYRRTQLTAEPIAKLTGVEPTVMPIEGDAEQYAQELAAAIEALNVVGPVLVVGHSNTVPPLIAALGAIEPVIEENEYDHLFILRRWGDARVDLIHSRYGNQPE